MCGFAGIYKYNVVSAADVKSVEAMSESIKHRGPDDSGLFKGEKAVFGFRRLSIIDLEGGAQPYTEKTGRYSIVYNGEIYNYLELKAELEKKGETFDGNSEVEVMLRLYSLYGADFVEKLRGMFAFLIYDKEEGTLLAARDPFGIKPLYYRPTEEGVVFSSELKAYRYDGGYDGFKVDKVQAQHYLTFQYVTEPDTITGDIFILPKGCYMLLKGKEMEKRCYWRPVFRPNMQTGYGAKQKRLREAIEDSVAHHMLSDVPLGSFLSSGIDSAVITAVAAKLQPGIKAFTVGFNVRGYSEIADAAAISSHLDINHVKLECTIDDFVENFEKTIYHLDGPVGDPSVVAIYLICREAARHVKVVLSGEGSDEIFAGYRIYDTSRSSASLRRLPSFLKSTLYAMSRLLPDGVKGKNLIYRGCVPLEKRFVGNSFVFDEKEKKKLYVPYDKNVHYTDRTAHIYKEAGERGYSELLRMQHCDFNTWLPSDILVKGDRLSMASSLEARVPFLDKEVFAAAVDLLDGEKLKDGTTKFILRDTFRDLLNAETVVRPKLGYPVPVRVWLKDELYDWARKIIESNTATDYINTAEALKLLEEHRKGKRDLYHHIWVILCFITWHKLYVSSKKGTDRKNS